LSSWPEALGASTALVAVAEIGDKTQLLSFVLAARLRRPVPIVAGILVATLANHALAGALGRWLAGHVADARLVTWVSGGAFIAFGLWMLKPDKPGAEPRLLRAGAFATTTVAFFFAEMADKTQFATVALGARFPDSLAAVVLGTTLGMLLANVPAVLMGQALAHRLPVERTRWVAAALFIATGVWTLLSSRAATLLARGL